MTVGAIDREQRTFEPIPTSARAARRFVAEMLGRHGASNAVIGDYQLVVSELATNIIQHGSGSSVVICVDLADPEWWDVEVLGGTAPPSHVLQPHTWTVSSAEHVSGRGLGIVRHLMDHVAAGIIGGQVSIRCRQRRLGAS